MNRLLEILKQFKYEKFRKQTPANGRLCVTAAIADTEGMLFRRRKNKSYPRCSPTQSMLDKNKNNNNIKVGSRSACLVPVTSRWQFRAKISVWNCQKLHPSKAHSEIERGKENNLSQWLVKTIDSCRKQWFLAYSFSFVQ